MAKYDLTLCYALQDGLVWKHYRTLGRSRLSRGAARNVLELVPKKAERISQLVGGSLFNARAATMEVVTKRRMMHPVAKPCVGAVNVLQGWIPFHGHLNSIGTRNGTCSMMVNVLSILSESLQNATMHPVDRDQKWDNVAQNRVDAGVLGDSQQYVTHLLWKLDVRQLEKHEFHIILASHHKRRTQKELENSLGGRGSAVDLVGAVGKEKEGDQPRCLYSQEEPGRADGRIITTLPRGLFWAFGGSKIEERTVGFGGYRMEDTVGYGMNWITSRGRVVGPIIWQKLVDVWEFGPNRHGNECAEGLDCRGKNRTQG
ncbi:hypothetical protein BDQ17DRAFT_1410120 [Cyathus striatus]|nr:hypothetical protein BDQ17DRAFT_1410120 [Cyathus striatus]